MITCIAVWSTGQTRVPGLRPEFRADFKRQVIKLHAKRKAEAMV